jgi:hypothetical protein
VLLVEECPGKMESRCADGSGERKKVPYFLLSKQAESEEINRCSLKSKIAQAEPNQTSPISSKAQSTSYLMREKSLHEIFSRESDSAI